MGILQFECLASVQKYAVENCLIEDILKAKGHLQIYYISAFLKGVNRFQSLFKCESFC